jgi:pyruvate carboxylase
MAMFLISRGIKPADVLNLEPGSVPFPASVMDMLMGNLGQPAGGWPKKLQKVILGDRKPIRGRPGAELKPLPLKKTREELSVKLKREATEDDLFGYLMYPEVFTDFAKFARDYSDVSVLPTAAFFYGLKPGEEISVEIEEGKTLFIKLIHVGDVDKDARRIVTFELNGMTREAAIVDRSVQPKAKARPKADPAQLTQIAAPIPGLITSLSTSVGAKVAKGDKLLTLEAMKMQSTLYASCNGAVEAVYAHVGDTVESKDLLIKLRAL